jgi:hypothetical protein
VDASRITWRLDCLGRSRHRRFAFPLSPDRRLARPPHGLCLLASRFELANGTVKLHQSASATSPGWTERF